nr:AI-2E family transporter [Corynebacterium aquatimens]
MTRHRDDQAPALTQSDSPTAMEDLQKETAKKDAPEQVAAEHEQPDRVDRTLVINAWMKASALFALRAIAILILLGIAFYLIGTFWGGIMPIIMALIVCTVLAPPTGWMRKRGVPDGLAAFISMLLFFAAVVTLLYLILPEIRSKAPGIASSLVQGILRLGVYLEGPPFNIDFSKFNEAVGDIMTFIQERAGAIAGGVFSGISTATSVMFTLFTILILTFFFLKDGPKFLPWVRRATGGRAGLHATELLTRSWQTLGGFIRAQAIVSLVDAVCIGLGLFFLNVPMAFTLAVITFMAGFIPIVGAVIAGALAVIVALVTNDFTTAVFVLILVCAVQQLEGNILSPMLQSKAMDLHPVVVLVSVMVGGGLFGLMGGFLAVPVAAMIAVALRYMQDMIRLHSGEISAKDLTFATDVGKALAEVEEKESAHKRREMLADHAWTAPEIADPYAETSKRSTQRPLSWRDVSPQRVAKSFSRRRGSGADS